MSRIEPADVWTFNARIKGLFMAFVVEHDPDGRLRLRERPIRDDVRTVIECGRELAGRMRAQNGDPNKLLEFLRFLDACQYRRAKRAWPLAMASLDTVIIKLPGWQRLRVDGDIAELDGKTYPLSGANDRLFLSTLQAKRGAPTAANLLRETLHEDPSRIYARLPKPIKRIIVKPMKRGQRIGYSMR